MTLRSCLKTNKLTICTVIGVLCGVALGLILRETSAESWTSREVMYINFIGDLFLRILKALILPLIVSSLISAIGSLDFTLSRKIGSRAILYYLLTTILAVILGIILVLLIKPGVIDSNSPGIGGVQEGGQTLNRNVTTTDTMLDLVRNMFPPNIIQACIEQIQTELIPPAAGSPEENDILKWKISENYTRSMNILGLVVVSCVVGITLSMTRSNTGNVLILFNEVSFIMMKITGWVIWLSPVGVLFLIAAKILEMDDLATVVGRLGLYFVTVLVGIFVHGFVVLPLIYFIFTRKNPVTFVTNMGQAMATAFGTSSSSATLPITIQCLEENNNIDPRVARFVLPIGATINMDGTALYEAVAAIFIAQLRGRNLSFGDIIAISLTATGAAIGAAGIPQAGLVTMVMVLDTIGLPVEDVSLIVAVDWLLDRFRTVVNVIGDCYGAGIVAHLNRKELETLDSSQNKEITNSAITLEEDERL